MLLRFRTQSGWPMAAAPFCVVALCVLAGCGGETKDDGFKRRDSVSKSDGSQGGEEPKFVPPAGDASVPPDQGGPGFTGEGWEPKASQPPEGSPNAVKGGLIRYGIGEFPTTVRPIGEDANTVTNTVIEGLVYQRLLGRHTDTNEYVPQLATHWQISEDRKTFRFRLNPHAHWSDGKPVVAEDVVATWKLYMDTKILDPSQQVIFSRFEEPKAISKYIVEVQAKEVHWRNFLYIAAGMSIFPAHELKDLPGDEYLKKYQFSMMTGSGPYTAAPGDIKQGEFVKLRRRDDFWGQAEPENQGLFNFDMIWFVTNAGDYYTISFEKMKKGEIDVVQIMKAQQWAEEVPSVEAVKRGLIQARQIYNDEPAGIQGLAMNMRKAPLDDVRVRKALNYLQNRELMIEKLFFNQYKAINSYHPRSKFANPNNEEITYNPAEAEKLLAEAGWGEKDNNGIRIKDGQRLEIELLFVHSPTIERVLTVFQEDCQRGGVKINLKPTTGPTLFQTVMGDRNYQMASMAWSGSLDPDPELNWSARLADEKNNNNITGFKNDRVEEIIKDYATMFEVEQRVKALQEVDGIVYKDFPYVLEWGSDSSRLLFWNKFGMPDWYLGRTSRAEEVLSLWWYDATKDEQLKEARKDKSITLEPTGIQPSRYWQERTK